MHSLMLDLECVFVKEKGIRVKLQRGEKVTHSEVGTFM